MEKHIMNNGKRVVGGLSLAVMIIGCSKSAPGKRLHSQQGLPSTNGVTLEIAGTSGPGYVELAGGPAKNGTPVTLTFTTPCGTQKVTFPFAHDSLTSRDRENVTVPLEKIPLVTFVRVDPRVKSPVTISGRSITGEAVSEFGTGFSDAFFWGMDCGGKAKVSNTEFAIPVWTMPTDEAAKSKILAKGNSLFVTDRAENCFELRNLYYGDSSSPPPPPTLLRGQNAYWVDRNIDFFMIKEETSVKSYAKGSSMLSLQAVDCPTQ
jgi:hypothetical protein